MQQAQARGECSFAPTASHSKFDMSAQKTVALCGYVLFETLKPTDIEIPVTARFASVQHLHPF